MNIDLIIIGLISLVIGLIGQLIDKPRSARKKRDVPLGFTEAQFKISKWMLIVVGMFCVIYGLVQ